LQFNPFSLSLYVQWQLWSGLMMRNGVVMGAEFRLYPVKPLSFRGKLGFQTFESFSLGEVEIEAGFLLKAWEVFMGWRGWTFGAEHPESAVSWAGPYAGIRRYF
jgi:hypothetical protein